MKKRLLSSLLALCLLLSLLPVNVLAAGERTVYPVEGGNIYFNANTGEITGADKAITAADIPAQIGGAAVTGIMANAFGDDISAGLACQQLRRVTLPEGLTHIGNEAFAKCIALEEIHIPSTVTSIGESAFLDCGQLREITLPEGLTALGSGAFIRCTSLKTVTIPGSVGVVRHALFSGCTGLEEVRIGEGITEIVDNAFAGNDSLRVLHVPHSVKKILGLRYSPMLKSLKDIHYGGTASEWEGLMSSIGQGYAKQFAGVTIHTSDSAGSTVKPETPGVEIGETPTATHYTITFDPNGTGVQNCPAAKTVEEGDMCPQPMDPTRPGYIFAGWYRNPQGTGDPYFSTYFLSDLVEQDLTLYAKWKLPFRWTKSDLFDFVSKDPEAKSGYHENMPRYCLKAPKGLAEKWESADFQDSSHDDYLIHNISNFGSIFLFNGTDTAIWKGYPVSGDTYDFLQTIPYGGRNYKTLNGVKQQVPLANWDDFIGSNWLGSCYGMSAVMLLAEDGQISPSHFGASTVSQFTCPAENEATANLVNFYQLIQNSVPMNSMSHTIESTSNNIAAYDFIHALQTNDKPLLLSIGILNDPALTVIEGTHIVLAYNCVLVPATAQEPAHFEVDIWDSNRSAAENLGADHTILSIPAEDLREPYTNSSDTQKPTFSHIYDAPFIDKDGKPGHRYSVLNYYLTVEDISSINLQTKTVRPRTIHENATLSRMADAIMRTNYSSFSIRASSGASAVVENGIKTSGLLDITGGAALDGAVLNDVGQDLLLEFTLPALAPGESYTITPNPQRSVVTGEMITAYSTVISDFNENGYFSRTVAADTGTITVTGTGATTAAFPAAVDQSVTVVRNGADTPWFNNTAYSRSTGLTADPLSDGSVRFTSKDSAALTLAVKDEEGTTVFDPVTPDASGVRIAQQGENTAAVLNAKGTVIASKSTAASGTPDTPGAPEGTLPFTDVKPGQWFYDAVAYAYGRGLMTGVTADTFAPGGTTTRGMIATILHRLEGSPAAGPADFTDVPAGQWYTPAVNWAAETGVVSGYGDGLFAPNAPISREQLVTMLWRCSGSPAAGGDLSAFTDADQISAYAKEAVGWAVSVGILNGSGGRIDPKGQATRAQVAQLLKNFLEKE